MSHNGLSPAVVITGATNGIGRAMALQAADKGRAIVLVGRSEQRLAEVSEEVARRGGQPFALNLDLLAENAVGQVQDFLSARSLFCDILVNSAGRGVQGLAASQPPETQIGAIDLNVRVLVEMTLALVPAMVAHGGGGVINLGSIAGLVPGPQMAVYYASKSFVSSFSQALHEELRCTGVTVTCVTPGPVETEFLNGRGIKEATIFSWLPALSAEEVATSAWRGFAERRRVVVPGIASRVAAFVTRLVPRRLLVPIISSLQQRNDKCPCGSGRKFRHCHGRQKSRYGWFSRRVLPRSRQSP